MAFNTKYKIEERDKLLTLGIIRAIGFERAVDIALDRSFGVISKNPESILCVTFLAWSHNLLEEARASDDDEVAGDLRLLSYFYRKLSHRVYWEQRKSGDLGEMNHFLREVT